MKLKETARRIWRYLETLADALEYDEQTDLRLRVERLESLVSDVNARNRHDHWPITQKDW